MKILTADPPPHEMEEVLGRRKALGQDGYDEVWDGVYHIVLVPHPWHGLVQAKVMVLVGRAADERGLITTGPFNLGEENDYRCPDAGVHQNMQDDLYVPTALVVVEIVSPDDDAFRKFDFYWENQVQEILTVERDKRVQWWERRSTYSPTEESDLLGLHAELLTAQIVWP